MGINTASLVTVLGVVSLALSLSVQNILTNVFSGITLLISKPFSRMTIKIGEPISSIGCTVEELTEKLKLAIEKLAPIPA